MVRRTAKFIVFYLTEADVQHKVVRSRSISFEHEQQLYKATTRTRKKRYHTDAPSEPERAITAFIFVQTRKKEKRTKEDFVLKAKLQQS